MSHKKHSILLLLTALAIFSLSAYSVQDPNNLPRKPLTNARKTAFTLKTGESVLGKVISEDINQLTILEVKQSKMVTNVYQRNNIDLKTLTYSTLPEYKYWQELGDYFYNRTWDFNDDPDDFLQSQRCCEKAKDLLTESLGSNHPLVKELTEKIENITQEQIKWEAQAQTRARLTKLEIESTLELKLNEIKEIAQQNSESTASEIKNFSQNIKTRSSCSRQPSPLPAKTPPTNSAPSITASADSKTT